MKRMERARRQLFCALMLLGAVTGWAVAFESAETIGAAITVTTGQFATFCLAFYIALALEGGDST